MKRVIAALLSLSLVFASTACGNHASKASVGSLASQTIQSKQSDASVTNNAAAPAATAEPATSKFDVNIEGIATLDDLKARVNEDLNAIIDPLFDEWEALREDVDSYEKYRENADRVSEYYRTIYQDTEKICIMFKEYCAAYVRMVLDSDMSFEEKSDAVYDIYDEVFYDAIGRIDDDINYGILEDMEDHLYGDVLADEPEDDDEYEEWDFAGTEEYELNEDTSSKVEELYYEIDSAIDTFTAGVNDALYDENTDLAEKKYEVFLKNIARDKGLDTSVSAAGAKFDTTLRTAAGTEEFEGVVDAHAAECIQALREEWKAQAADTNTYEKYKANAAAVEEFHGRVAEAANEISVLICNYGAAYAEMILQSGASTEEMYKAFDSFQDIFYEDALYLVKKEIYRDLLDEIKDYYYGGVIKEAMDLGQQSDWIFVRRKAYGWWSDAHYEVYGSWTDARSALTMFSYNVRGALDSGDLDEANAVLQDFRDNIEKIR